MSIAFLMDGSAAMKMIRSTRSTSIIGVTLISLLRPAEPPADIDMLLGSSRRCRRRCAAGGRRLLGVARDGGDRVGLLIADQTNDTNAVLHRDVHGVENLGVLQVLVGLEIHDVVVAW